MSTAPESTDTPRIIELADGLCVRIEVDNIAWIDLGDYGLVVDALERPETKDEVFAAISRTLGDKPLRYVLNTHTHYDHVALNDAFSRQWQAEIVNQQTAPLGAEGRWFRGPKRSCHMLPMPGAHTPEDCIVWVPEDRVLFVGDIFGWGLIPLVGRLRNDSAKRLMHIYQKLVDYDAEVVVAGHGPLLTTDHLRRYIAYVRWLFESITQGVRQGRSDAEIASDLPAPEDMRSWWRFVQWKHADTVKKVTSAIRRSDWDRPV